MATSVNPYAAPQAEVDRAAEGDEVEPVRIFSASGRLGRVRYLGYVMAVYLVLMVVVGGLAGLTMGMRGGRGDPGALLYVPIVIGYIAMIVMHFLFAIQRLHDFEAPGWWSLLALVPVANLILALVLLFKPGTDGRNKYGGRTPPNGAGVIVLACLLPAVFVLGVVAAIALPAYQGYAKRAQQSQLQAPR